MSRTLYYDIWAGVLGHVMLARVWGHPGNPNYDTWQVNTIGM